MAHLYVMQNQHGLVKIGRSARPEFRRKQLEKSELCAIVTIAVIENAGEREEECHIALNEYRLIGEWFHGTDAARQAIADQVGLPPSSVWPHRLASTDILEEWLEAVEERRWAVRVDKEFQRHIRDMEMRQFAVGETDTVRWDDGKIWNLIWGFEAGLAAGVDVGERKKGGPKFWGICEDKPDIPLPHYSTVLDDALTVWPDEARPSTWEGTPRECCIAGLKARKLTLNAS